MPIRNGNDKTARRRLLVRARNDNDSVESNINVRNKARKRRSGREKGAADGGLARGYCVLPRTKAAPARTSTLQALLQAQNKPRCFPYNRIISKFTSNSNRTARCFPIELRNLFHLYYAIDNILHRVSASDYYLFHRIHRYVTHK